MDVGRAPAAVLPAVVLPAAAEADWAFTLKNTMPSVALGIFAAWYSLKNMYKEKRIAL